MTIFSLMSVGWGCDEGYTEIDGECYYQSDLDVLQDFIDLNETLSQEEPLEIGDQGWNNTRLTYLGLGNRSLMSIPDNIGNLNHLEYLFLSSNHLSVLPESIGNLNSLKYLFLSYNQFTVLPNTIGELSSLESLYLNSNQLFILPDTICNLPENSYIYFDNNQLCPPYPECLSENGWLLGYQDPSECEEPSLCNEETEVELWGECYNIDETTVLDFGGEQLLGEIPEEICNLTNLTELELGGNQLSGEIPSCIGNLNNLTFIHLEYNQLSGEIPSEIGNLINLIWLNFVHNQLSGEIPSSICNLDMNWSNPDNFNIYENQLCPPYPECIEDYVGEQDTSECEDCSFVPGDLNDDLSLDVMDVILMVGCILSDNCNECSDINQDGSTDILDIVDLVNVILNQ